MLFKNVLHEPWGLRPAANEETHHGWTRIDTDQERICVNPCESVVEESFWREAVNDSERERVGDHTVRES